MRHLQQGAQGGRRFETPLAYGDFHEREWAIPFWRNLKKITTSGVIILK